MKGRLKFEFLTLQLIDNRRKAEHNPSIRRDNERRVVERHLRELEQLSRAEWLNSQPSKLASIPSPETRWPLGASPNPFSRSPETGRSVGSTGDQAGMGHRLVPGEPTISAADGAGRCGAGGRERLEPKPREHSRRSDVPGVRNDERAGPWWSSWKRAAFSDCVVRLIACTSGWIFQAAAGQQWGRGGKFA